MFSLLEIIARITPIEEDCLRNPQKYHTKQIETSILCAINYTSFDVCVKLILRARNRKDKYSALVEKLTIHRIKQSPIARATVIEKYMKIVSNERKKSRAKLVQEGLYVYDRKQSLVRCNFMNATCESDWQYERNIPIYLCDDVL